jgi:hypothetical protein
MKEVKVGQIYKDNDKRVGERKVIVLSLIEGVTPDNKNRKAVCQDLFAYERRDLGHKTKIRCDRLLRGGSTGYVLVSDLAPEGLTKVDPDANLDEQLDLTRAILSEDETAAARWGSKEEQAHRLAELIHALDGWIRGGGFLPKAWTEGKS